jgi:hypothetical protein
MIEQPYSGRAVITDNLSEINMIIPARKNWIMIIFLSFWLCGWLFGAVMVTATMFRTHNVANLFIGVWLLFWLSAGFVIMNIVAWQIFGKEIVTIGNGIISIRRTGTLFRKNKSYDLAHVTNVYAKEQPLYNRGYNNTKSLFNRGTINFEYGLKTVRFGDGLDEAEARHIIEMLKAKKFIQ